jgi:hypothetical protein
MSYTVHLLQLNRAIFRDSDGTGDGTISVKCWRSAASQKNLEASRESQLCGDGAEVPEIEPGFYLFTQGVQGPEGPNEDEYRSAAEAVWLESLWRKTDLKNDRVLIRTLTEDNRIVFQIFREIKA